MRFFCCPSLVSRAHGYCDSAPEPLDNRHWASDVAAGAAIGTFSGWKAVRYSHSHPGNEVDGVLLGVTIPTGGGPALLWIAPAPR
ncbi:hypothetical protein BH20GEM2_BH20GEM2_18280 [soil metagenome]